MSTYDASANGKLAATASLTWNHPVGVGPNRILFVFVGGWDGTGRSATATFNALAMTALSGGDSGLSSSADRIWGFRLVNPPSGTFQVVVTITGGTMHLIGGSHSFSDADQATFDAAVTAVSLTPDLTTTGLTVTSQTGDLIAEAIVVGANVTALVDPASSSFQTERWDTALAPQAEAGMGSTATGAPSRTLFWDWAAGTPSWAEIGVNVRSATSSAGPAGFPVPQSRPFPFKPGSPRRR